MTIKTIENATWTKVIKTYPATKRGHVHTASLEVSNVSIEAKGGIEVVTEMFSDNWKHTRDQCGLVIKGYFTFDGHKFMTALFGEN